MAVPAFHIYGHKPSCQVSVLYIFIILTCLICVQLLRETLCWLGPCDGYKAVDCLNYPAYQGRIIYVFISKQINGLNVWLITIRLTHLSV